jgi:hypothetical protein
VGTAAGVALHILHGIRILDILTSLIDDVMGRGLRERVKVL